jgi:hypothetical protein
MKADPLNPGKHIDPRTGIWPIEEWGAACQRGFVSHERFARPTDTVIKRTNDTTRKWRKLNPTDSR